MWELEDTHPPSAFSAPAGSCSQACCRTARRWPSGWCPRAGRRRTCCLQPRGWGWTQVKGLLPSQRHPTTQTAHPQLLHFTAPWGFVQEEEIIARCGALAPGMAARKAPPQPLWLQTGFAVRIPTWTILQTNLLQECVSMETSKQNGSSGLPYAHLEDIREWYLKAQFITGLAQTLQHSESLSNSMEYETCLEITTRRPESVGMLVSNTLHNTKRRKLPVWARILLLNLILKAT